MAPTRRGKIARLPLAIRDELNRRLLENEPYKKLCAWLNALPETIAVCDDFGEEPIDVRNMSDWKLGGYADWLRRRETIEETRELSKYAVQIAKANGGNITEGAAAILSGQILEVLEDIAHLKSEGPLAPEQTAMVAAAVGSITKSLAAVRKGDHSKVKLEQNEKTIEQRDEMISLDREKFQREIAGSALKVLKDERARQIEAGAGTNEEKIEIMGQHLFGELWNPRTEPGQNGQAVP
jgi:hypothetical protein